VQVELAIDEADVIIFVVDVEEGITMDDAVARLLRKVTKPVLLEVRLTMQCVRKMRLSSII
jgi:GTP-binding protein